MEFLHAIYGVIRMHRPLYLYLCYAYNTCVLHIIFVIPFILCTVAGESLALAYLHPSIQNKQKKTLGPVKRELNEVSRSCSSDLT